MKEYLKLLKKMALGFGVFAVLNSCTSNNPVIQAGYPDRLPDLDVLQGFQNPPKGYGNVPFYWWIGDTLTKDRIIWQLEQLEGMGITGLQVNYCHTDTGGASYGLTYPSQPALFTEEWWDLFGWFLQEAKKRNMSVSLSDYTLGAAGQGWYVDEMLAENPELYGSKLELMQVEVSGNQIFETVVPDNLISATALKSVNGKVEPSSSVSIQSNIKDSVLTWNVPSGNWKVLFIHRVVVKTSFDPMHPMSGPKVVEKFFQRFEDHFPGEAGEGLNFFFSDELTIGIRGFLWNDSFAGEFQKRKGYDIFSKLPHLFVDVDSVSYKIRLDYYDVMVELSEDGFFKPVYDWHTSRGMLYGCDHGGRGQDVTEFGDYFRTQRWMSGPGADQPGLGRNIIKAKVASSISHLYERPRTWLEGFYGSGWGTSSEELAGAIFTNYAMGFNLLSLHGLYYTTHGSWWEWAAPENHFRQPYWKHAESLMKCNERLSYILSQGHHVCDVALMYPVEPVQAALHGEKAVQTAFDIARDLYPAGIDFDFMDYQSLERCKVNGNHLEVSNEKYKVLILPAMSAVRYSTIEKALEFYRSGGIVLAVGALPEVSDRIGGNDTQMNTILQEIFGTISPAQYDSAKVSIRENKAGGKGIFIKNPMEAKKVISGLFTPDFKIENGDGTPYVLHRKAGFRDIYFVYGLPKGTVCFFRTKGKVELWNTWDGSVSDVSVSSVTEEGTLLKLPMDENQPQLLVFSSGEPKIANLSETEKVNTEVIEIDNEWEFELKPTLDNKYGDYRLPAFDGKLGVEVWKMKFTPETDDNSNWKSPEFDDDNWQTAEVSFGQQFWKLGPLPDVQDYSFLESKLAGMTDIYPEEPVEVNGKKYFWHPYEFSWRWGLKDDAGHQGYHGLKGKVNNDIFSFGKIDRSWRHMPSYPLHPEPEGTTYYLFSKVLSPNKQIAGIKKGGLLPSAFWMNNKPGDPGSRKKELKSGANPVLLKYTDVGRGYFVFIEDEKDHPFEKPVALATDWYLNPLVLPFDCFSDKQQQFGRYRFLSPPGTKAVYIVSKAKPEAWINGAECKVEQGQPETGRVADDELTTWKATAPKVQSKSAMVAVRLEQLPGLYGGAAITEPVVFENGNGKIELGNLFENEALKTYSGGMWYRKTISLNETQARADEVILDLGRVVASAEVHINGKPAGIKSVPPWEFDLTGNLNPGDNKIEILVYNTLGNHFLTTPSQYIGRTDSGLMGPVSLYFGYADKQD
jgi:hypothetical protein